ncbi:MAG TPA: DHH family phosphoesterase, partial [Methanocorpusculum sp.]|nr:DHH family phosphoesterase [Methanocorpusculum sp.]
MKSIYVIGHRHPDTDSICSVIGYVAYLNKQGSGQYIAARCGDLNAESRYALEKFGVEAPELILSVEPSVADIPFTYPQSATANTPTIDVIEAMDANDLRNLPITDGAGKLIGLVSEHGLARAYVSTIKRENLTMSPMPVDILARILSAKICVKKHDVLEREREVFLHGQQREDGTWEVDGCLRRGVDQQTALELFKEIESFASYAFNKPHAAGYAVVAYQTAYLKCHYPCEYMAALLSSVLGQTGKVAEYIEECGRLGISVLPPHVNYSDTGFTV